jgi:CBS domain-containing protein
MNKHHIRHLPVIDDYTLIGVITIQDISTALENNGNDAAQSAVA